MILAISSGLMQSIELMVITCTVVWVIGLVRLCSRRDIEIHTKLNWVVTVLVLHALGALIYFVFGPERRAPVHEDPTDTPFNPEGKSWNPIVGENFMPEGEGLNPGESGTTGDTPQHNA